MEPIGLDIRERGDLKVERHSVFFKDTLSGFYPQAMYLTNTNNQQNNDIP